MQHGGGTATKPKMFEVLKLRHSESRNSKPTPEIERGQSNPNYHDMDVSMKPNCTRVGVH